MSSQLTCVALGGISQRAGCPRTSLEPIPALGLPLSGFLLLLFSLRPVPQRTTYATYCLTDLIHPKAVKVNHDQEVTCRQSAQT